MSDFGQHTDLELAEEVMAAAHQLRNRVEALVQRNPRALHLPAQLRLTNTSLLGLQHAHEALELVKRGPP